MDDVVVLRVSPAGQAVAVYTETIDLAAFGRVTTRRASHVEPDGAQWTADMNPVGGPCLGPFAHRSQALAAESAWLTARLQQGFPGLNPRCDQEQLSP